MKGILIKKGKQINGETAEESVHACTIQLMSSGLIRAHCPVGVLNYTSYDTPCSRDGGGVGELKGYMAPPCGVQLYMQKQYVKIKSQLYY